MLLRVGAGANTGTGVVSGGGTVGACPFAYLYLRNGIWDGERVLPEGWVDYTRTGSPQSEGSYGAHFWTIPGSLGLFSCQGAWGQRILISPKLDLVVVRVGETSPHKVAAVVQFCKGLVDLFRPTAE